MKSSEISELMIAMLVLSVLLAILAFLGQRFGCISECTFQQCYEAEIPILEEECNGGVTGSVISSDGSDPDSFGSYPGDTTNNNISSGLIEMHTEVF